MLDSTNNIAAKPRVIVTASRYAEHSAHSTSLGTQITHFYGNKSALFKERNQKLLDLARIIITNGVFFDINAYQRK